MTDMQKKKSLQWLWQLLGKKSKAEEEQHQELGLGLVQPLSHVRRCAAPRTAPRQAPLPTGFPRQEPCSGLPLPPPGHLPDPGIEPMSPELPVPFQVTAFFLSTFMIWAIGCACLIC